MNEGLQEQARNPEFLLFLLHFSLPVRLVIVILRYLCRELKADDLYHYFDH